VLRQPRLHQKIPQFSPLRFILASLLLPGINRKNQNKLLRHLSFPRFILPISAIFQPLLGLFWFILHLPEFILLSFKRRSCPE
jgi:hypothetical protein